MKKKKLLRSNGELRARVMKVFLVNNKLRIEGILFLSYIILLQTFVREKKRLSKTLQRLHHYRQKQNIEQLSSNISLKYTFPV